MTRPPLFFAFPNVNGIKKIFFHTHYDLFTAKEWPRAT